MLFEIKFIMNIERETDELFLFLEKYKIVIVY